MDKGKEDALRTAFKMTLMKMLEDTKDILMDDDNLTDIYTNQLLKEVTIRTA